MNMKHSLHLFILVLTSFFSTTSLFAYDFEVDGICYNVLSAEEGTCEVTYKELYNSNYYSGDIVIPSTVTNVDKTYRVIRIGDNAFYLSFNMTSITMPDDVTSLGESAFYYCSGLSAVTMPKSLTDIGSKAFYLCM